MTEYEAKFNLSIAKILFPKKDWKINDTNHVICEEDLIVFDYTGVNEFGKMTLFLAASIKQNPQNLIWTGNAHGYCHPQTAVYYILTSANANKDMANAILDIK